MALLAQDQAQLHHQKVETATIQYLAPSRQPAEAAGVVTTRHTKLVQMAVVVAGVERLPQDQTEERAIPQALLHLKAATAGMEQQITLLIETAGVAAEQVQLAQRQLRLQMPPEMVALERHLLFREVPLLMLAAAAVAHLRPEQQDQQALVVVVPGQQDKLSETLEPQIPAVAVAAAELGLVLEQMAQLAAPVSSSSNTKFQPQPRYLPSSPRRNGSHRRVR